MEWATLKTKVASSTYNNTNKICDSTYASKFEDNGSGIHYSGQFADEPIAIDGDCCITATATVNYDDFSGKASHVTVSAKFRNRNASSGCDCY